MLHLIQIILHVDTYLVDIVNQYGTWIYAILTAVIFCETGLVVTPFLPGDSLLFAAGSLAAIGKMKVHLLFLLLATAAVLGDNVNYAFGRFLGEKAMLAKEGRFFKREYLERTHHFFEKHGGRTLVLARFMPIIRTFAPFVAGAGHMRYIRFLGFSVLGGILWTSLFIYGGYFFGNLPVVQHNFTLVIMGIIVVSFLPGIVGYLRHRSERESVVEE
jgi:membrane-associated protein